MSSEYNRIVNKIHKGDDITESEQLYLMYYYIKYKPKTGVMGFDTEEHINDRVKHYHNVIQEIKNNM